MDEELTRQLSSLQQTIQMLSGMDMASLPDSSPSPPKFRPSSSNLPSRSSPPPPQSSFVPSSSSSPPLKSQPRPSQPRPNDDFANQQSRQQQQQQRPATTPAGGSNSSAVQSRSAIRSVAYPSATLSPAPQAPAVTVAPSGITPKKTVQSQYATSNTTSQTTPRPRGDREQQQQQQQQQITPQRSSTSVASGTSNGDQYNNNNAASSSKKREHHHHHHHHSSSSSSSNANPPPPSNSRGATPSIFPSPKSTNNNNAVLVTGVDFSPYRPLRSGGGGATAAPSSQNRNSSSTATTATIGLADLEAASKHFEQQRSLLQRLEKESQQSRSRTNSPPAFPSTSTPLQSTISSSSTAAASTAVLDRVNALLQQANHRILSGQTPPLFYPSAREREVVSEKRSDSVPILNNTNSNNGERIQLSLAPSSYTPITPSNSSTILQGVPTAAATSSSDISLNLNRKFASASPSLLPQQQPTYQLSSRSRSASPVSLGRRSSPLRGAAESAAVLGEGSAAICASCRGSYLLSEGMGHLQQLKVLQDKLEESMARERTIANAMSELKNELKQMSEVAAKERERAASWEKYAAAIEEERKSQMLSMNHQLREFKARAGIAVATARAETEALLATTSSPGIFQAQFQQQQQKIDQMMGGATGDDKVAAEREDALRQTVEAMSAAAQVIEQQLASLLFNFDRTVSASDFGRLKNSMTTTHTMISKLTPPSQIKTMQDVERIIASTAVSSISHASRTSVLSSPSPVQSVNRSSPAAQTQQSSPMELERLQLKSNQQEQQRKSVDGAAASTVLFQPRAALPTNSEASNSVPTEESKRASKTMLAAPVALNASPSPQPSSSSSPKIDSKTNSISTVPRVESPVPSAATTATTATATSTVSPAPTASDADDSQKKSKEKMIAKAPPEEQEGLPPGWIAVLDKTRGECYFWHKERKITTWTRPSFPSGGVAGAGAARSGSPTNSTEKRSGSPTLAPMNFKERKDSLRPESVPHVIKMVAQSQQPSESESKAQSATTPQWDKVQQPQQQQPSASSSPPPTTNLPPIPTTTSSSNSSVVSQEGSTKSSASARASTPPPAATTTSTSTATAAPAATATPPKATTSAQSTENKNNNNNPPAASAAAPTTTTAPAASSSTPTKPAPAVKGPAPTSNAAPAAAVASETNAATTATATATTAEKSKKPIKAPSQIQQGLPAGWIAVADPNTGGYYYWNKEKKLTTWDRPT